MSSNEQVLRPRVLGVIAHPDDESIFASVAYRIVHELGGSFALAIVTNGEAGFRYATLAEHLYGHPLTHEVVGRRLLPEIRQHEMRDAGEIMGVSEYHFLGLKDTAYGVDPAPLLEGQWDCHDLASRLAQILGESRFDFVFTMLPVRNEHAHHQVCAIVTVEAVAALPLDRRPVVLSALEYSAGGRPAFSGVDGRPVTRVAPDAPVFEVDRRTPLGHDGSLSYQVVVNWILAAHRTQGLAQMQMGSRHIEGFWTYAINGRAGDARAAALFAQLDPGS